MRKSVSVIKYSTIYIRFIILCKLLLILKELHGLFQHSFYCDAPCSALWYNGLVKVWWNNITELITENIYLSLLFYLNPSNCGLSLGRIIWLFYLIVNSLIKTVWICLLNCLSWTKMIHMNQYWMYMHFCLLCKKWVCSYVVIWNKA